MLIDKFKSFVRYVMPFRPRCLRWIMVILSGPVAFDLLACLIASLTSAAKIVGQSSSLSFLIFLSKILLDGFDLCMVKLVYCWLKLSAIALGVIFWFFSE